ncbi:unnamed protein product [Lymnaea stagnalis]|uniref:Schlafen AlbA-2 domain-containing protein n=1 Tax=Lymnaea stagnalis TaxID=6523 RepID=A0AAV2I6N1_LYMST
MDSPIVVTGFEEPKKITGLSRIHPVLVKEVMGLFIRPLFTSHVISEDEMVTRLLALLDAVGMRSVDITFIRINSKGACAKVGLSSVVAEDYAIQTQMDRNYLQHLYDLSQITDCVDLLRIDRLEKFIHLEASDIKPKKCATPPECHEPRSPTKMTTPRPPRVHLVKKTSTPKIHPCGCPQTPHYILGEGLGSENRHFIYLWMETSWRDLEGFSEDVGVNVCGFLNSGGGVMCVGVEGYGKVSGTLFSEQQQRQVSGWMSEVVKRIKPGIGEDEYSLRFVSVFELTAEQGEKGKGGAPGAKQAAGSRQAPGAKQAPPSGAEFERRDTGRRVLEICVKPSEPVTYPENLYSYCDKLYLRRDGSTMEIKPETTEMVCKRKKK